MLGFFQLINSSGQKLYSMFHPGMLTSSQIIRSAAGMCQAEPLAVQASTTCAPGTQHGAGPIPACPTKEPLPQSHRELMLAPVVGEAASHLSANRAENPVVKQAPLCPSPASLSFKRRFQLSLGITQDDATKQLP